MEEINNKILIEKEKLDSVESALGTISQTELQQNKYPIIVAISNKTFQEYNEAKSNIDFWKEVFNPRNFIYPGSGIFDENTDRLFIIHSFNNKDGGDTIFKAITTRPKDFISDPVNYINYQLHGQPCELRSSGRYPTKDFWEFYDDLLPKEQNNYPIPDTNWRQNFYKENFTSS